MLKNKISKKKPHPEDGHYENKYWCDCRTRKRRAWLCVKISGVIDEEYMV